MLILEYNNKFYLKINGVTVKEVADMLRKDALQIENAFKKDHPYIVDLPFGKYGCQKKASRLHDIVLLKLIRFMNQLYIYIYIYIQNGIVRISFKTF